MGRTNKKAKGKKKRGGGKKQDEAKGNCDGERDANPPLPLGIGTRVEIRGGDEWNTGTVTRHWMELPEEMKAGLPRDQVAAPYYVRLDDGTGLLIMVHSEETIRESYTPPLPLTHKLGSRVECKVGADDQEWIAGTVIQVHVDWVEKDTSPYMIHLDNGGDVEFWGPQDCIRESKTTSSMKRTGLRFTVGDRVSCRVGPGEDEWADGTVIKLWWRQKEQFANDYVVPYQIQLDAGDQIFAPSDVDECIMRSSSPPPHCWICFENDQSEGDVIVRECACRGGENGFVHVSCLVTLAQKKVEDDDPDLAEFNPFSTCITCKTPFKVGSRSSSALAKAFYDTYKDRDIDDLCNKQATTSFAELLVREEEYNKASDFLNERISKIRLMIEYGNDAYDTTYLMVDLANFLLDLAGAYDEMGSLNEMKDALDESIFLLKGVNKFEEGRKWSAIKLLAKHAYKSGDKSGALKHMEELANLGPEEESDQFRSQSLIKCGNLNLECCNKQRGLEQIIKGVDIMSTLFGKNHSSVRIAREYIHKIEQGLMDKLPSENLQTIL